MRIGEPTNSLLVRLEGLTHKFEQGLERIQEYEKEVDAQKEILIEAIKIRDARIAELEEEQVILKDQMREAKNILIDKRLHIDSLYEEGYKLQKRIAELEAAQRWIPVSERLPLLRDSKAVLVYTKSGETYSGLYLGNNEWTGLLHDFREGEVTHWMPLPEPPEVQE